MKGYRLTPLVKIQNCHLKAIRMQRYSKHENVVPFSEQPLFGDNLKHYKLEGTVWMDLKDWEIPCNKQIIYLHDTGLMDNFLHAVRSS